MSPDDLTHLPQQAAQTSSLDQMPQLGTRSISTSPRSNCHLLFLYTHRGEEPPLVVGLGTITYTLTLLVAASTRTLRPSPARSEVLGTSPPVLPTAVLLTTLAWVHQVILPSSPTAVQHQRTRNQGGCAVQHQCTRNQGGCAVVLCWWSESDCEGARHLSYLD